MRLAKRETIEPSHLAKPEPREYDGERVRALRAQLGYEFGALIECETRQRHQPAIAILEWLSE